MENYSIFRNYTIWASDFSCPATAYVFELVQKDGSNRPAEKWVGAWRFHRRGLLSRMDLLKKARYYMLLYKALQISHLCTILIVPSQEKLIYMVKRRSWGTENCFTGGIIYGRGLHLSYCKMKTKEDYDCYLPL